MKPTVIGMDMENYTSTILMGIEETHNFGNFEGNAAALRQTIQECTDGATLLMEFGPEYEESTERLAAIRRQFPDLPIIVATYYPMGLLAAAENRCVGLDISSRNNGWYSQLNESVTEAKKLVAPV